MNKSTGKSDVTKYREWNRALRSPTADDWTLEGDFEALQHFLDLWRRRLGEEVLRRALREFLVGRWLRQEVLGNSSCKTQVQTIFRKEVVNVVCGENSLYAVDIHAI